VLGVVSLDRRRNDGPTDEELRDRFGLSAREVQVARLMAAGRTTPQIAAALGISPHTARRHGERTFTKLGARSRHEVRALLRGTES
jgi:DNA-binding CsgD family transcriptional regulator